ncbi:hypothetical protein ACTHQW_16025 [Dietzia maris]
MNGVVGSLAGLLGTLEGSVENLGGSIASLVGIGAGSLADNLEPVLEALTSASDRAPDAGK